MANAEAIVENGKNFRPLFVWKNGQEPGKGSNTSIFREGMNKLTFMKFSRCNCIVICFILQMYTPLCSPFEKWNNEREKAEHSLKHKS